MFLLPVFQKLYFRYQLHKMLQLCPAALTRTHQHDYKQNQVNWAKNLNKQFWSPLALTELTILERVIGWEKWEMRKIQYFGSYHLLVNDSGINMLRKILIIAIQGIKTCQCTSHHWCPISWESNQLLKGNFPHNLKTLDLLNIASPLNLSKVMKVFLDREILKCYINKNY